MPEQNGTPKSIEPTRRGCNYAKKQPLRQAKPGDQGCFAGIAPRQFRITGQIRRPIAGALEWQTALHVRPYCCCFSQSDSRPCEVVLPITQGDSEGDLTQRCCRHAAERHRADADLPPGNQGCDARPSPSS